MPAHLEAIRRHGPCPIHRRSFEPVKGITGWSRQGAAGAAGAAKGKGRGKGRGAGCEASVAQGAAAKGAMASADEAPAAGKKRKGRS